MRKIKLSEGVLSFTDEIELFYEKTVTCFGNGCKIDAPKDFLGRKVYVLVCKDESKRK
jgi:putative transposon-encoded protein